MSRNRNHNLDSMFTLIGNPEVYTYMAVIRVYDPESEETASYALGFGASDHVPMIGDFEDLADKGSGHVGDAVGNGVFHGVLSDPGRDRGRAG